VNAPPKFPRHRAGRSTTITSRAFNQHTGEAKKAADHGPVFITERGKPAYVLLSAAEYERLGNKPMSVAEALADPRAEADDPDLMDFIPRRQVEPIRFRFDEEQ
jgi:prevent-host-death family protein